MVFDATTPARSHTRSHTAADALVARCNANMVSEHFERTHKKKYTWKTAARAHQHLQPGQHGCCDDLCQGMGLDTPPCDKDVTHIGLCAPPGCTCSSMPAGPTSTQVGDVAVQGIRYASNLVVNLLVTFIAQVLRLVVPPPVNDLIARLLAWITQKLL